MRGHAPLEPMDPYICVWGGVADIINCAKFLENPSKPTSLMPDPEKRHFPLTLFIALRPTTVSALWCRTVIKTSTAA